MKNFRCLYVSIIHAWSHSAAPITRPAIRNKHLLLPVLFITSIAACADDSPKLPTTGAAVATTSMPAADSDKIQRAKDAKDPGAASSLTPADAKITDEITRRINEAMNSPMIGKGIQVLTVNGKVILRGTVKNPDEKNDIGVIAAKVAGADNVTNNIECMNEH